MGEFKPGDIIVCDCCGSQMMRVVVGMNKSGYVVENVKRERRHVISKACAESWWRKAGGEK